MNALLLQSIDIISESDKKISQATLIKKFLNTFDYVIKIIINLLFIKKKCLSL